MLKHFVVTRLGLGVYDERWFARMIDLFEATTLNSLAGQSSQLFTWFIVTDAQIPPKARDKLESLLRGRSNYHLLRIDLTRLLHVRHGCFDWVWDHCQEFILENRLLDDPCDYIITSLIDADDAWHRDVVSTINTFVSDRLPAARVGEKDRGSAIRHTSGMAVTFPRGYKWIITANCLEPMEYAFLSMGVFVAARFSSGISACSSRHGQWRSYCNVLAFEVHEIQQDQPMWVYVRHHRTMQPWDARGLTPAHPTLNEELQRSFGVDMEKMRVWQAAHQPHDAGGAVPAFHSGCSVTDQFDRFFRIAALNRKIEALQRRRDAPAQQQSTAAATSAIDDEIARTQDQRGELIDALRASRPNSNA